MNEESRMSTEKIVAETRTEFGKGAARRIRREHKVPAVLYGHGNDPIHVTGANALLELEIEGEPQLALTKQVQVDPVRRTLEHVDFVVVRRGEKVTVDVPVNVIGDAGPDTLVVTENSVLEVEAEATHIPESFDIDITGAPAGTQFLAGDVTLPKGTTLIGDPEMLMVNVTAQQSAEAVEAELEAAEADAGIEKDEHTPTEGEATQAAGGDSE
jgi:large subunit ribosomal protein L25